MRIRCKKRWKEPSPDEKAAGGVAAQQRVTHSYKSFRCRVGHKGNIIKINKRM